MCEECLRDALVRVLRAPVFAPGVSHAPSERSSLQSVQLSLGDGVDFRLSEPLPLTQHPAAVCLSGLGEGSVSTMRHSLDAIAFLLTDSECDALTVDWSK
ncbi:MAG: hypothetical protein BRC52_14265 [Cyanobacteria bacterium SW_5_48_44]|nr:MAG: hypothetical protein BRC52_14265 [Cyanobacteria bacterium SW_5_48_44]